MKRQPLTSGKCARMNLNSRCKNLKSFNQWDKEEHRKVSSKGGINSGIARRKKREAIEREKAELQALIEWSNDIRWLMEFTK